MKNHSWVALIGFCATWSLAIAAAFALLIAGATLAFAVSLDRSPKQQADAAPAQIFDGMITDSDCRARHNPDSGKTSAECVRACVRQGGMFTLVDGEKSYSLAGNSLELDRAAGQRARIVGDLEGTTIRVQSIALD